MNMLKKNEEEIDTNNNQNLESDRITENTNNDKNTIAPSKSFVLPSKSFSNKVRLFFNKISSLISSFIRKVKFAKKPKEEETRTTIIAEKLRDITEQYEKKENKVPYLEINTNPLNIPLEKTNRFTTLKNINMTHISDFIINEHKTETAQLSIVVFPGRHGKPGHATCGLITGTGDKVIVDNNGLSISKTYTTRDLKNNNIKYVKAESSNNNWCGPASLENIESICAIYQEIYKKGVNGNHDFSSVKNQRLVNNNEMMELIKNDSKIFLEKQKPITKKHQQVNTVFRDKLENKRREKTGVSI